MVLIVSSDDTVAECLKGTAWRCLTVAGAIRLENTLISMFGIYDTFKFHPWVRVERHVSEDNTGL